MNPLDKIHPSWKLIKDILEQKKGNLFKLDEVLSNNKYYPEKEDIFNVFSMPLEDIKVVILGQDPYPKEGQAIGYAFAVSEETPKPASLRIIEQEVGHSIDKTLKSWREQGVFLLNTALTVEARKAGSHTEYWYQFMCAVIACISIKQPCIWLLWGAKAQRFKSAIIGDSNSILMAPHPASEAYKPGSGFIGCNHFKQVNSILESQNKSIINF